jgi:hypothetical protein
MPAVSGSENLFNRQISTANHAAPQSRIAARTRTEGSSEMAIGAVTSAAMVHNANEIRMTNICRDPKTGFPIFALRRDLNGLLDQFEPMPRRDWNS